jgi:hypothetical protein
VIRLAKRYLYAALVQDTCVLFKAFRVYFRVAQFPLVPAQPTEHSNIEGGYDETAARITEIAELKKIVAEFECHEVKLRNLEANNKELATKCDELLEKYRDIVNLSRPLLPALATIDPKLEKA